MNHDPTENQMWMVIYKNISIFEVIFFVIFLYFTYLAARDLWYAKATEKWPTVQGEVKAIDKIKRHFEDHLEITCEYQVAGNKYTTQKIFLDEYLSDVSKSTLPLPDINEPPPLSFLRLMKRIINGKISNITICFHYIISRFPIFYTLKTELISRYETGNSIQIYYAPGKPDVAIVKPGASIPFYIVMGLSIFLTLTVTRNIVASVLHALGITSLLLSLISYFILFLWFFVPLGLFLYLTGMASAIFKSIK